MTKVEEVARAICDVERQANGWAPLQPHESLEAAGTRWYTEMARAAIEAMRVPSAGMVEGRGPGPIVLHNSAASRDCYTAMIDAALQEGA